MTTQGSPFDFDFDNSPIFNQQSLIEGIFGQAPELAFLGSVEQAGLPQNLQRFFRSQTSDFLRRFQGQLGSALLQGTPEAGREAADFFGDLNFQNEFLALPPAARGFDLPQFVPPARFIFR